MPSNTDFFRRLKHLRKQLETAPAALPQTIMRNLGEEAHALISEGFRTQTDPYGERWKDKLIADGRGTLSGDTSRLKNFAPAVISRLGFRISATVNYAVHHQYGTGIYGRHGRRIVPTKAKALKIPGLGYRKSVAGSPIRMMVPSKQRGLPRSWSRAFKDLAAEVIQDHFK
jgi:phage gpG-like protein